MANKRVKVTIEGTYELLPKFYPGCTTPEEMMRLDEANPNLNTESLLESLGDTVKIKFQVVEE